MQKNRFSLHKYETERWDAEQAMQDQSPLQRSIQNDGDDSSQRSYSEDFTKLLRETIFNQRDPTILNSPELESSDKIINLSRTTKLFPRDERRLAIISISASGMN